MARVLSNAEALDVAGKILNLSRTEDARLARADAYLTGSYVPKVYIPQRATNQQAIAEFAAIVERSKVPVLSIPVDLMVQNLFVDGYRPSGARKNAASWESWQANRMDARQTPVHRDAVGLGPAYLSVLPGKPAPVWRTIAARRGRAVYVDRLNDEWPQFFLETWTEGSVDGPIQRMRLLDDEHLYTGTVAGDASSVVAEEHGTGFCPVVRFIGSHTLDGQCVGEVEPLIPLQDQADAATLNIEMAQQYAVHRQRWATGMMIPEDDDGNPVEPFRAAIDRLWVAEDPDTKFGEFGQTDIKSWLDAREATLRHIAMKSQSPPGSLLLGASVTFPSAEAAKATENPHQRRISGTKTSLGESWEQGFRLDALQRGDIAGWEDQSAAVQWRDLGAQSLAANADALGKLAQMLGVPQRALWSFIPGVTDSDIADWEAMRSTELQQSADMAARSFGVEFAQPADVPVDVEDGAA